jgi:hypothetical protein
MSVSRIHRIGQTKSRWSLAADCPCTSMHLDGTGLLDIKDTDKGRTQRVRLTDEGDMGEQRLQRLHQLE